MESSGQILEYGTLYYDIKKLEDGLLLCLSFEKGDAFFRLFLTPAIKTYFSEGKISIYFKNWHDESRLTGLSFPFDIVLPLSIHYHSDFVYFYLESGLMMVSFSYDHAHQCFLPVMCMYQ